MANEKKSSFVPTIRTIDDHKVIEFLLYDNHDYGLLHPIDSMGSQGIIYIQFSYH